MSLLERATAAVRTILQKQADESGSWITDPHPDTGVWSYEGEIPDEAIARAVLAAIREPDETMIKAGVLAPNYLEDQSSKRGCANIYTAMIDAILAGDQ